MNIEPVVVPIKALWIPLEKILFFLANSIEQRADVVRAKDIFIFNGEGKKHFKSFLRFTRLLFHPIDCLLYSINHPFVASAAPAWMRARQQLRSFLRSFIHQRNRGRFKSFGRNGKGSERAESSRNTRKPSSSSSLFWRRNKPTKPMIRSMLLGFESPVAA